MKLKDTGSLVNWIQGNARGVKPEVGMGVTFLHWTDRNPGTIVEIDEKSGIIAVQADDYKRIDKNGFSENQDYEYTPNPMAPKSYFRMNKKTGRWEGISMNPETNRWNKNSQSIYVGEREKYHDFSF